MRPTGESLLLGGESSDLWMIIEEAANVVGIRNALKTGYSGGPGNRVSATANPP